MNIINLPQEIINLIQTYIPVKYLVFVNKTFYHLYHYRLKPFIPLYDNYIRDIIRRDNSFVYREILCENFEKWLLLKKYYYKNMVFNNYVYFVLHYCIENNSDRCREILIEYLKKRNLYKNLHKKIVVKYIK
jgi:hypothetical protein